jgi:uncharacterized phage protein (TIGR01671 family)
MREIKFRGKRYGDKSWVYGNLYQGTKEGEQYSIILNDEGYYVAPQDDRNIAIAFFENEVNVVFPNTVGQYTGLKDKNGKEIYEGDIIGCHNPNIKHLIFFNEKQGRFMAALDGDIENDYYGVCGLDDSRWNATKEVIGNIHDNPELINKEE